MSNPDENPVDAFKKLLNEETTVQKTVRSVSSKPTLEYLMNPLPLSPMLLDAFKDPVKALKKFMAQHVSKVQEDLVEFEGLILPRNAVSLAVASIFEYA
ncbi:MAG: hypothetical protein Q6353_010980, partial [Candidatus Sigynarchaeum springense]